LNDVELASGVDLELARANLARNDRSRRRYVTRGGSAARRLDMRVQHDEAALARPRSMLRATIPGGRH
jgi:hypothetical protein